MLTTIWIEVVPDFVRWRRSRISSVDSPDRYRQDSIAKVDVHLKPKDFVPAETCSRQVVQRHAHHHFGWMDESDFRDLLCGSADCIVPAMIGE